MLDIFLSEYLLLQFLDFVRRQYHLAHSHVYRVTLKLCVLHCPDSMEYIFDDRALILRSEELTVLVATDLHIGYEIDTLERTGAAFPDQKEPLLKRLKALVDRYHLDHIYLIGDIKHSIGVDRAYNWREIPSFMEELSRWVDLTVIPGNHDGDVIALLPRNVHLGDVHGELAPFDSHRIGLIHGHAWPSSEVLECDTIVMGHNHPTVRRVKDVSSPQIGRPDRKRASHIIPVALKTKLDRDCVRRAQEQLEIGDGTSTLVVLPSFNDLLTGVYVNRPNVKLQGPIFDNDCVTLVNSEVYSSTGIFLGTIEMLQKQFLDSGQ